MSLYSEREICAGCVHASWHECGNCLRECAVNAQDERDHCDGSCPRRERKQDQP